MSAGTQGECTVKDLMGLHPFSATEIAVKDRKHLCQLLQSENTKKPIRALGTNYSLSNVGVAGGGTVLRTGNLCKFLGLPWPSTPEMDALQAAKRPSNITKTLTEWQDWKASYLRSGCEENALQTLIQSSQTYERIRATKDAHFVHVEAGIPIKDLLRALKPLGLSLPTMGSGGGQSLIGALATASHGGDFNERLLADAIVAIHLVNPMGEEYWITADATMERPSYLRDVAYSEEIYQSIRKNQGANAATVYKRVAEIRSQPAVPLPDKTLQAVAVAAGRAGVIYSVVLRVVRDYGLLELNTRHSWDWVKERCKSKTLFDCPLSLYSDKQKTERHAFLTAGKAPFVRVLDEKGLPGVYLQAEDNKDNVPPPSGSENQSPAETSELRHLNLAISLLHPQDCYVTRRWKISNTATTSLKAEFTEPGGSGILDYLKSIGKHAVPVAIAVQVGSALVPYSQLLALGRIVRSIHASDKNAVEQLLTVFRKNSDDFGKMIRAVVPEVFKIPSVQNALTPFGVNLSDEAERWLLKVLSGEEPAYSYVGARPLLTGLVGLVFLGPLGFAIGHIYGNAEVLASGTIQSELGKQLLEMLKKFMGEGDHDWTESQVNAMSSIARLLLDTAARNAKEENLDAWRGIIQTVRDFIQDEKLPGLLEPLKLNLDTAYAILSRKLMQLEYSKVLRVGWSTEMLDTHNYSMDHVVSVHSAEFFFDADRDTYLKFIEAVIERSKDISTGTSQFATLKSWDTKCKPVVGFIGIRFMPATEALIGMQAWKNTVSVEVAEMRHTAIGRRPSEFFEAVLSEARNISAKTKDEARPHWGQQFQHDEADIKELYGDRLKTWRACLAAVGVKPQDGFLNDFAYDLGLQPDQIRS